MVEGGEREREGEEGGGGMERAINQVFLFLFLFFEFFFADFFSSEDSFIHGCWTFFEERFKRKERRVMQGFLFDQ